MCDSFSQRIDDLYPKDQDQLGDFDLDHSFIVLKRHRPFKVGDHLEPNQNQLGKIS